MIRYFLTGCWFFLILSVHHAEWWFPYTGFGSGTYYSSIGFHGWGDHLNLRNLSIRQTTFLAPGVRIHSVLRSNRAFDELETVEPTFDELYVERFGFWNQSNWQVSHQLSMGRYRYLRFPHPDMISQFDQVPGTEDLRLDIPSHYQGVRTVFDIFHRRGFGWHTHALLWVDSPYNGINMIENYGYYHIKSRYLILETRVGMHQRRTFPLGRGGFGASIYGGFKLKGYQVGVLYETINHEPIRTGVLVKFAPSIFSRFAGLVHLDYTRNPEGFVMQLPLLKGSYGLAKKAPAGYQKVGEMHSERLLTYWQNGQGRNSYDHFHRRQGKVSGADLVYVIQEDPWLLQVESLVSPHNQFRDWDDLVEWEKKRQGPAQQSQRIRYDVYQKTSSN